MKVIIIGVNHAGTSAVRTLLSQNPALEVVAYDRNTNISFLGCGIALTVSGVVNDINSLFYSNAQELTTLGAKIHMAHDVTDVNPETKSITVKNIETGEVTHDQYDKLIYAAGSWPVNFPVPGNDLKNIEICKLFQHAETLIERANDESIQNVTIIGAGYIGIELAESYQLKGKNVTLLDLCERVVPNYFDSEFTERLEDDMRKHGIDLVLGAKVTAYKGDGDKVTHVVTDSAGEFPADLVIQSIGARPNTAIFPNADKVGNGALKVGPDMQTSMPDIYAIGDSAAMYNAALKEHSYIALATNAVKGGLVAASQINGASHVTLPSVVGTNAICVFDNNLASTGLSEEAANKAGLKVKSSFFRDNDRPEFMNEFDQVSVKLVYEEDTFRLVGAQIGSYGKHLHTECIYYLALAIQKEMSLVEIATTDVYFLPHYNKPFNFILCAIMRAIGLNYV